MNRPIATLVLSSIVALAACTGDSNDGRVAGPDPVTVPPTTEAPPTAPPTEESSGTDPADTSGTTSTTQPATTTTVDRLVEIEVAVARDFAAAEEATLQAIADPGSPVAEQLLQRFHADSVLERLLNDLEDLRRDGLVGKPNPEVPQVVMLLDRPRLVDKRLDRVRVTTCRVDAAIIFLPGEPGEADDVIVNDTIRRVVAESEFELKDNIWRLASGESLFNEVGVTTCDGA